jgi:hypothetical protein
VVLSSSEGHWKAWNYFITDDSQARMLFFISFEGLDFSLGQFEYPDSCASGEW